MIRIIHPYSQNQIIADIAAANPSKKQTPERSLELWHKYQTFVERQIGKSIMLANNQLLEDNCCHFPLKKLQEHLGRPMNSTYWSHWFQQHYPLFKIIKQGQRGEHYTMITPLFPLDIELDENLIATSNSAEQAFHDAILPFKDYEEFDLAPIDLDNLRNYILKTLDERTKTDNPKKLKTIVINLYKAKCIEAVATYMEQTNGVATIPQPVVESEYGRRYYAGLNLQNCSKILREAALGPCWQYDINASVYAWRLNQIKKIDPALKCSYTLEYLDNKKQIREQLATALQIKGSKEYKVNIIKQLITAVGFGAKLTGSIWRDNAGALHYGSITNIVKDPEARKELLEHPWLRAFHAEQQAISKIIFEYYADSVKDHEFLKSTSGRLSQNKTLAYLYQHYEREIMDAITQHLGDKVILRVHDAFYTKQPIKIIEVREIAAQFNNEIKIDKKEIAAWRYFDERELQAHRERILKLETDLHNGKIPNYILNNYKRFDSMRKRQAEYNSLGEYDNGNRKESLYDPEMDPFYMEEQ